MNRVLEDSEERSGEGVLAQRLVEQVLRSNGDARMGDKDPNPALIGDNETQRARIAQLIIEHRKKWADFFKAASMALKEKIARLNREIAALDDEISQLNSDLASIRRMQERLDAGLEIERNPDGSLADSAVEARLQQYEAATGRRVDRSDDDALRAALSDLDDYMEGLIDAATLQRRQLEREREDAQADLSVIDNAQEAMGAIVGDMGVSTPSGEGGVTESQEQIEAVIDGVDAIIAALDEDLIVIDLEGEIQALDMQIETGQPDSAPIETAELSMDFGWN